MMKVWSAVQIEPWRVCVCVCWVRFWSIRRHDDLLTRGDSRTKHHS